MTFVFGLVAVVPVLFVPLRTVDECLRKHAVHAWRDLHRLANVAPPNQSQVPPNEASRMIDIVHLGLYVAAIGDRSLAV
jgi:hypothetical protein